MIIFGIIRFFFYFQSDSIQIGYLEKEVRHTNKPEKWHFDKAGVPAKRILKEFAFDETENIKLNTKTILSGVSKALDREDCHYFVAEFNGEVAGQIMITHEWSDWRNGVIWWIQSVYVRP